MRLRDSGEAREAEAEIVQASPPEGGEPAPVGVGAELARARREAELTQRELADRLGVRLWMVDEWEAGKKAIPSDQLDPIATALGTSTERLLGGGGPSALEPSPSEAVSPPEPSEPASAPSDTPLTADQVRDAALPRGLRGYDEGATRRLLGEIAAHYEQVVAERDELVRQVEELEASAAAGDELERVVSERDELRQRVGKLPKRKDYEALAGERDGLRQRVDELEEKLAKREDSEQVLTRTLVAAGRAGEELVKEAEEEADRIRSEALRRADETERELEEQRRSIERERNAVRQQLRREALASAREDLMALQQDAEPLLAALTALSGRLDALVVPEQGEAAGEHPVGSELLEDLQRSQPAEAAGVVDTGPR